LLFLTEYQTYGQVTVSSFFDSLSLAIKTADLFGNMLQQEVLFMQQ